MACVYPTRTRRSARDDEAQRAGVLRLRTQVAVLGVPAAGRERVRERGDPALHRLRFGAPPRGLRAADVRVKERLGPAVEGLDEAVGAVERDRRRGDGHVAAEAPGDG